MFFHETPEVRRMSVYRAITNDRSPQGPGIVHYFVSDSLESAQRDAPDADVEEMTDEALVEMEEAAAVREATEWVDVE